jgi:hypothetical protein
MHGLLHESRGHLPWSSYHDDESSDESFLREGVQQHFERARTLRVVGSRESALSFSSCLAPWSAVLAGTSFDAARAGPLRVTLSPLLTALPNATILQIDRPTGTTSVDVGTSWSSLDHDTRRRYSRIQRRTHQATSSRRRGTELRAAARGIGRTSAPDADGFTRCVLGTDHCNNCGAA